MRRLVGRPLWSPVSGRQRLCSRGGTPQGRPLRWLVVSGSHRLLNNGSRGRSKNIKTLLRRLPYFRELMSKESVDRGRFLTTPGSAQDPNEGDVSLRVVELCGRPGDVYLTDMRLLHTLAPNATCEPRIMLTHRLVDRGVRRLGVDRMRPITTRCPATTERAPYRPPAWHRPGTRAPPGRCRVTPAAPRECPRRSAVRARPRAWPRRGWGCGS